MHEHKKAIDKMGNAIAHSSPQKSSCELFYGHYAISLVKFTGFSLSFCHCGQNIDTLLHTWGQRRVKKKGYHLQVLWASRVNGDTIVSIIIWMKNAARKKDTAIIHGLSYTTSYDVFQKPFGYITTNLRLKNSLNNGLQADGEHQKSWRLPYELGTL